MTLPVLSIALASPGCSSLDRAERVRDQDLVRTFNQTGVDTTMCLHLEADHTFVRYLGGFFVLGTEEEKMRSGEKGRWTREADKLTFFPPTGPGFELRIRKEAGRVSLEPVPDLGGGLDYK